MKSHRYFRFDFNLGSTGATTLRRGVTSSAIGCHAASLPMRAGPPSVIRPDYLARECQPALQRPKRLSETARYRVDTNYCVLEPIIAPKKFTTNSSRVAP
jgi:hypothetical protein